jgi:hypothetical protein
MQARQPRGNCAVQPPTSVRSDIRHDLVAPRHSAVQVGHGRVGEQRAGALRAPLPCVAPLDVGGQGSEPARLMSARPPRCPPGPRPPRGASPRPMPCSGGGAGGAGPPYTPLCGYSHGAPAGSGSAAQPCGAPPGPGRAPGGGGAPGTWYNIGPANGAPPLPWPARRPHRSCLCGPSVRLATCSNQAGAAASESAMHSLSPALRLPHGLASVRRIRTSVHIKGQPQAGRLSPAAGAAMRLSVHGSSGDDAWRAHGGLPVTLH